MYKVGIPTTQTDANGNSTTKLLDGFGRVYGERAFNAGGVKIAEVYMPIVATVPGSNERYMQRQVASGGSTSEGYFDELQREVRRVAKAFATNAWAETRVVYDAAGRKVSTQKPAGSGTLTTAWTYDTLNRLATETMSGTALSLTSSYGYGVLASTTIDAATVGPLKSATITQTGTGIVSRTTTKYTNSQGQTVRIVDGEGGTTNFVFDPHGNLLKAIGPTGIAEQMTYDLRGRKLTLANPDSGTWSYEYNGAGELVRQTDANLQVTRSFHDALGRTVERREHPGSEATTPFVTVTSYDRYADTSACAYGKGKPCEVRTGTQTRTTPGAILASPQVRQSTVFDIAGRPTRGTTEIDGRSYVTTTTFDPNGRVDKLQYPSGYMVVHRYTAWSGALDQVAEWTGSATGQVHWLATARYPDGQLGTAQVGSTNLARDYDGFGRVKAIAAGVGANPTSLQNLALTFDAVGNLTNRTETVLTPANQSYGYDRVDRMTSDAGSAVSYDAAGNIQSRGGTAYSYVAGTHRMTAHGSTGYAYDANGNVTSITGGTTRTITPTAFNLPATITQGTTTLGYVYDAGHKRIKETATTAAGTTTTYYLGSYEELTRTDAVTERRHWIASPDGPVGTHITRSDGSSAPRYWLVDHLGSVVGVVDPAGTLTQRSSYAAWGGKTQIANTDPRAEDRGFTGHEHLAEVNLVHMNGRVYDPQTGRFLAADPIIQDPYDAQSYNRYSYVRNNPLSFTDPSGFSWWTKWRKPIIAIAAAAITMGAATWAMGAYAMSAGTSTAFATLAGATETGAVITGFGNATASVAAGFAAGGIQGGNIESAVGGALSAGMFFGAGSLADGLMGASSAFAHGGLGRSALHAGAGCMLGATAGGGCGKQALAAGFSEVVGTAIATRIPEGAGRLVAHAVAGGAGSVIGGGKFENGAVTGAFGYLFNELGHCYQRGYCSRQEHIQQKAAHCGSSLQCAREVVLEAQDAGMPIGPTMGNSLRDFGVQSVGGAAVGAALKISFDLAMSTPFITQALGPAGSVFGRERLGGSSIFNINSNEYLRVGWGWSGSAAEGQHVFRISSDWLRNVGVQSPHLDLFAAPKWLYPR